jgi:hypothetical protein
MFNENTLDMLDRMAHDEMIGEELAYIDDRLAKGSISGRVAKEAKRIINATDGDVVGWDAIHEAYDNLDHEDHSDDEYYE